MDTDRSGELSTVDFAPPADLFAALSNPTVQADGIWAICSWLRDMDGLYRTGNGLFVVSRYRDVAQVLAHPDVFVPEVDEFNRLYQEAVGHRSLAMITNNMAMTNPPRHTLLRRILSRGFTPRAVSGLRESIAKICDSLLDTVAEQLADGGVADFHTEFAEPLSLNVIAELVGVPAQDRPWMAKLVREILCYANPAAGEENLTRADETTNTMADYFSGLAADRRQHPGDDLISAWVASSGDDPAPLSDEDLLCSVWLLWLAGFETVAAAIGHSLLSMIEHPVAADLLRGDVDRVDKFIDESLRHDPPVIITGIFRMTREAVVIDGLGEIPAGAKVNALLAAANHDATVYEEPEVFNPHRTGPPSVAFGRGIHNCLGSTLARTQLRIALPMIQERLPDLSLAGVPQRRRGLPLRTFERLPVANSAGH